jgi:hypothetical protein
MDYRKVIHKDRDKWWTESEKTADEVSGGFASSVRGVSRLDVLESCGGDELLIPT